MSKIFFLFGEESFLIKQFINSYRKDKNTEFISIDAAGITEKNFIQQCSTLSFFNSEQIIHFSGILENKLIDPDQENIKNILLSPPEHLTLIFSHDGSPDKRKKLYKLLSKTSDVKEFKPLTGMELQKWLESEFQKNDAQISRSALNLLESFIGNNLWQLSKEIEKIAIHSGGKITEEEDIRNLTVASSESSVFDLVDSLGEKKTKKALELLHSLVKDRYDTIPLLAMIVRQIRLFIQCLSLKDQYGYQWKKHLQLHPFVLEKIEKQSRNFSLTLLKQIYEKLYDLDKKMKSTSNNPLGLLDNFVIELTCLIPIVG